MGRKEARASLKAGHSNVYTKKYANKRGRKSAELDMGREIREREEKAKEFEAKRVKLLKDFLKGKKALAKKKKKEAALKKKSEKEKKLKKVNSEVNK